MEIGPGFVLQHLELEFALSKDYNIVLWALAENYVLVT